jgi:ribosomal RNA large subunit methyltransferase H
MKITLVFVGKTVQQEVSSLTDDYISRIKGTDVSVKIVPNLKKKYPIEIQKTEEGREILKTVDKDDYVVLLDDKGKVFSSLDFASWLEKRQIHNRSIVFVVGGAYGFSQEMYQRADFKLSLSAMTFSHQIIRAIFAEQLYRAFSIIKGLPYHHE